MKRILALVVAVAVTAMFGDANAQAQDYSGGYLFGAGIGANNCGGFLRGFQREQPPYFAKFPPVYYSHIVKRPYGISPYAAPSGIAPVEMSVPAPMVMKNPYFQPDVETASENVEPTKDLPQTKTTWIRNAYFDSTQMVFATQ